LIITFREVEGFICLFVTAQAYQEVIIPWCKTDKNRAQ
jgi:hypothetical protein